MLSFYNFAILHPKYLYGNIMLNGRFGNTTYFNHESKDWFINVLIYNVCRYALKNKLKVTSLSKVIIK